jgi:hypothetical protein
MIDYEQETEKEKTDCEQTNMICNHNSASRGSARLTSTKEGKKCCHSVKLLFGTIHKRQLISCPERKQTMALKT